ALWPGEKRPQERPKRVLGEHRREISSSPPHRSLSKGFAEGAIALHEHASDPHGDSVAPRPAGPLWTFGSGGRGLRGATHRAEHARMLTKPLLFDSFDCSSQELQPGGTSREPEKRKDSELEGLQCGETLIEPTGDTIPRADEPPPAPVEPPELTWCFAQEFGEASESRPFRAAMDQPLLHSMGNDVPQAREHGPFVEYRLRRIPSLPE